MKITRSIVPGFILPVLVLSLQIHGQGFGTIAKKKIGLRRKLPAVVHLPGNAVQIRVASRDPKGNDLATQISDILQAELLKYNNNLRVDSSHPDAVISCNISNFSTPPIQQLVRNITETKKIGKSFQQVQEPKRFYEVKGTLDMTYQARDAHSGKTLDSDVINIKYSQEFDESGTSTSTMSKGWNAIKTPWNKVAGKSSTEQETVPTLSELQQTLARQASMRVSTRLVNTDEVVEVLLARGKLDDANKMADAGLWTRMLESLEQMPPFPNKEEDAYRLYNIGVAYEALGYQSEDPRAAKRFFDQSAISYGKAIDAKPAEKYFLEPQNRIETALAHYRKLEQQPIETAKTSSGSTIADSKAAGSSARADDAPTRSVPVGRPKKAPISNAAMKENLGTTAATPTKAAQDDTPPLTNEQVIKLFKAGMDEDNLISTINEARATNFDVSVDGALQLVNAGIKGKVLTAIRRKAATQKLHR
jgi:hypothetical protein